MTDINQKAHASKSPSGAKQWVTCPGSLAMEGTLPEGDRNQSSYFAQLGTATHHLIEDCLNDGRDPDDYADRLIEVFEDAVGGGTKMLPPGAKMPGGNRTIFEVDYDMAKAASYFTEYVRRIAAEHELVPSDSIKAERRAICLPERDDCYGTVDVTIDAWPDLLEVADYKNGAGVVVDVIGNHQTRLYLLGCAIETDWSHDLYRHTIIQPNASHPDGPIRSEELTRDELMQFHQDMLHAASTVDRAYEEFPGLLGDEADLDAWVDTYLSVGEDGSACRWCDAKSFCPAAKNQMQTLAKTDFDDDPLEPEVPHDPEELGKLLRWVPFMDTWLKELDVAGMRYLEGGGDSSLLGQKLVRKSSSGRKWNDEWKDNEKGLLAKLKKEFGITAAAMKPKLEPKLLSGPQTEKLIKGKEKQIAFSKDFLFKPEGGITMAPLDDKRPEIVQDTAAEDFDDEEL